METAISREDGRVVVLVSGELDALSCDSFEEQLGRLLDEGATKVVVDLAGVSYISSAGLRVLLGGARRLREQGTYCLSRPGQEVRQILETVGFATIMPIHDDLDRARDWVSGRLD